MDKRTKEASTSFDQVSSAFLRKQGPIFPPPASTPSVEFDPPDSELPSLFAEWRTEQLQELQKSSETSSRSLKVAITSAIIAGVSLLVSFVTVVLSVAGIL